MDINNRPTHLGCCFLTARSKTNTSINGIYNSNILHCSVNQCECEMTVSTVLNMVIFKSKLGYGLVSHFIQQTVSRYRVIFTSHDKVELIFHIYIYIYIHKTKYYMGWLGSWIFASTSVDFVKTNCPDSKVHGANIGPTWVLSAPDGPHVGPMNLAIRVFFNLDAISHRGTERHLLCFDMLLSHSMFAVPLKPISVIRFVDIERSSLWISAHVI